MIDNDAIIAKLFISILKRVAFNWFRSLSSGSINSWVDLKALFLFRFYEDDMEVIMDKFLSMVQREGESVRDYTKALQHFSYVPYRDAFTHKTCRYNFLDKVEVHMGDVKAHT